MFKIISDTACDYTLDYANSIDVTLVPFYVTFDEKNYYKDLYELSVEDFYQKSLTIKFTQKLHFLVSKITRIPFALC